MSYDTGTVHLAPFFFYRARLPTATTMSMTIVGRRFDLIIIY